MWYTPNLQADSHTAQLLIVDDEPNIRQPLARALSLAGYEVQEAGAGKEALRLLRQISFDLMLLDMNMPDLDGTAIMKEARTLCPQLSIVVLTGHPSLDNAIAAVKSDVEDYLCKPAAVCEVTATVARILRKNAQRRQREQLVSALTQMLEALHQTRAATSPESSPETLPEHVLYEPPLLLDRQMLQVTLETRPPCTVDLTKGETAVLAGFMSRANHIFTCAELVRAAWNYEADDIEAESIIRPYIFRLRRKLEPDSSQPQLIRTVRGRGYLLQTETT